MILVGRLLNCFKKKKKEKLKSGLTTPRAKMLLKKLMGNGKKNAVGSLVDVVQFEGSQDNVI